MDPPVTRPRAGWRGRPEEAGGAATPLLQSVVRVSSAFVAALSVGALAGWDGMLPLTAASLLALAVAAVLPTPADRVVAAVPLGLALWVLGGDLLSAGAKDDMSVLTACSVLLLATVRVLPETRRRGPGEVLVLGALLVSALALLGYAYGVRLFDMVGSGRSLMPPPAALAVLVLSVAALAAVRHGAATWLVYGRDAGALAMRRLMPVVLLGVPFVGLLVQRGHQQDLYGPRLAMALVTTSAVALMGASTWYTARLLTRVDERRQRAMTALTALNADLEDRARARAAELEAERSRLAVLDDRRRIAAEMHDHVLQGLYAVGLRLRAAAMAGPGASAMEEAVDGIDQAIRDLRASIFELKHPAEAGDLVTRLRRVVTTVAGPADVSFTGPDGGPVETVSDEIAENLVAVTREALSHAVRHGGATTATVDLAVTDADAVLTVDDDGKRVDPDTEPTVGMRSARGRAQRLGGSCWWAPRQPVGNVMTWRVPLHAGRVPAPGGPIHVPASPGLVDALVRCAAALAAAPRELLLDRIGEVATSRLKADHMSVGVAAPEDQMRLVAASGLPEGVRPVGLTAPRDGTLSGHVMETGEPLQVNDLADLPAALRLFGRLPLGPALMVPLGEGRPALGTFCVARHRDAPAFTTAELEEAQVFARFMALAVDKVGAW
jgi:signal transduction histidine kinase